MTLPKILLRGQTFQTWNDPYGNRLSSINRDGTVSVQGVNFPDGTTLKTATAAVTPPGGYSNPDMGTF